MWFYLKTLNKNYRINQLKKINNKFINDKFKNLRTKKKEFKKINLKPFLSRFKKK